MEVAERKFVMFPDSLEKADPPLRKSMGADRNSFPAERGMTLRGVFTWRRIHRERQPGRTTGYTVGETTPPAIPRSPVRLIIHCIDAKGRSCSLLTRLSGFVWSLNHC